MSPNITSGNINVFKNKKEVIFKNIDVTRIDIGEYMKTYVEENDLLKQLQRRLISRIIFTNGTLITFLFNFYVDLELQCTKTQRFVENTPR